MGAKQIKLLAVPLPNPPAMDPELPVPIDIPMALPAEPIGLIERDDFPVQQLEVVSFLRVVAVQAPERTLAVFQVDVVVHADEDTRLRICRMDVGPHKGFLFLGPARGAADLLPVTGLTGVYAAIDEGRRNGIMGLFCPFLSTSEFDEYK